MSADPSRIDDVTAENAAHLIAEIDYVLPYLEHVRALLHARLAVTRASASEPTVSNGKREADRLLDVNEAAERLSISTSALYRMAQDVPFTRRLPNGRLRFSSRGIARWIETR